MPLPAPHRIARIYYAPRLLGFALTFVAALVLLSERAISVAQLAYAAVVFLLYPQVVYLWSCLAADKKTAALRGLLIDALLLGSWVAAIGFNAGIGFCLFTSVCMNNTIYGGLRGLLKSAAMFAAGCLLAIAVLGLRFDPAGSLAGTYFGLLFLFIYVMKVATVFHAQNLVLVGAKREVDRKRLLFQGLAEAGLATSNASGLDELVTGWLRHLKASLPVGSGLGVIVRAPQRPGLTYHATFHGVDAAEQARLLTASAQAATAELSGQGGANGPPVIQPSDGDPAPVYEVLSIPVEAGLLDAVFLLRRDHRVTDVDRRAISLFLQQLGAALSNYGLTQKLTELANTDRLTGLANRARLDERLTQVIDQKRRQPSADFTVVMVDINGLKHANDMHGHETGDRLIVAAAQLLQRTCRDTDLIARLGGDEFIVLCPATTAAQASHFLQRLADAARDITVPCQSNDGTQIVLPLHVSVGVADSGETDPAAALKLADARMYEDKATYYRCHPKRS